MIHTIFINSETFYNQLNKDFNIKEKNYENIIFHFPYFKNHYILVYFNNNMKKLFKIQFDKNCPVLELYKSVQLSNESGLTIKFTKIVEKKEKCIDGESFFKNRSKTQNNIDKNIQKKYLFIFNYFFNLYNINKQYEKITDFLKKNKKALINNELNINETNLSELENHIIRSFKNVSVPEKSNYWNEQVNKYNKLSKELRLNVLLNNSRPESYLLYNDSDYKRISDNIKKTFFPFVSEDNYKSFLGDVVREFFQLNIQGSEEESNEFLIKLFDLLEPKFLLITTEIKRFYQTNDGEKYLQVQPKEKFWILKLDKVDFYRFKNFYELKNNYFLFELNNRVIEESIFTSNDFQIFENSTFDEKDIQTEQNFQKALGKIEAKLRYNREKEIFRKLKNKENLRNTLKRIMIEYIFNYGDYIVFYPLILFVNRIDKGYKESIDFHDIIKEINVNGWNINNTIYKLNSFIIHWSDSKDPIKNGFNLSSGHYTALIRKKNYWYHLDDLAKEKSRFKTDDSLMFKNKEETYNRGIPYIFFLQKTSIEYQEDKNFIQLPNIENSCFMNSALQCLFNIPGIDKKLFDSVRKDIMDFYPKN